MAKTSIISQIATRAKAIRRKSPGKKWQTCIKEASKELKGTGKKKKETGRQTVRRKKIGTTKYRQTGKSNRKRDKERTALAPGKRKNSAGSGFYYERRKNRSDVPGSLTGIKKTALASLAKGLLARDQANTLKQHKAAVKTIAAARKRLSAFK